MRESENYFVTILMWKKKIILRFYRELEHLAFKSPQIVCHLVND